MARCVCQTLISSTTSAAKINPYSSLFSTVKPPRNLLRFLSLRTKYAVHVVGPNDNTTNNNTDAADVEAMAVQKIEDAIHRIVVRKSVPDWLSFVPGGSYWVPPKRHLDGLPQLIHTIANALTEEEYLSLTNVRGWPSSTFYSSVLHACVAVAVAAHSLWMRRKIITQLSLSDKLDAEILRIMSDTSYCPAEAETLCSKTSEAEAYEDEESEDKGGAN